MPYPLFSSNVHERALRACGTRLAPTGAKRRPNHSKPDGLRIKKSGWGMKCLIHFFSSNVHERIRTSDLPLRSSPEFCLSRYHKLSNIAYFQSFWMVRIACSYHCFHLIPVRRMPSLLPPCCKAQKFSRTSSVSISTI